MRKDELQGILERMHGVILDVVTHSRLDAQSRRRLGEVAKEVLELSRELAEAPQPPDQGFADRVVGLLSAVAAVVLRVFNGT
jgi:hypothetical protein